MIYTYKTMKKLTVLWVASLVLLGTGCSTNVVVEGDVPKPLSAGMPVGVALVIDKDFKNYVYTDDTKQKISFAIGKAQTKMFRTISQGLFREVRELESLPEGAGPMELILAPRVDEIQLATPFETQLNVFEVWIRYNLRVFNSKGEPLADWIMTAYGKTPTRFLGSDEDALNQAAIVALRDAGARMTLEFPRVPEIRTWLNRTLAENQMTTPAEPGEMP